MSRKKFIRCKVPSVRYTSLTFSWVNLCTEVIIKLKLRPKVNLFISFTFINNGMANLPDQLQFPQCTGKPKGLGLLETLRNLIY